LIKYQPVVDKISTKKVKDEYYRDYITYAIA